MSKAIEITNLELSSPELRACAKVGKNPLIVRRMLAIALVLEGMDRTSAARACGMDRQTLRDWVHHYNRGGIAGLGERRRSQRKPKLDASQRQAFAALVEQGPDPAVHQVVRWRCCDLQAVLKAQFGVEVHERTVGKYLDKLGYRRLSVRPQHPDGDPETEAAFKKTSRKCWQRHSPRKPVASLSKSGSRTKPVSASKAL